MKQSNQVAVSLWLTSKGFPCTGGSSSQSVCLADINLSPGQALLRQLAVLAFLLVNESLELPTGSPISYSSPSSDDHQSSGDVEVYSLVMALMMMSPDRRDITLQVLLSRRPL